MIMSTHIMQRIASFRQMLSIHGRDRLLMGRSSGQRTVYSRTRPMNQIIARPKRPGTASYLLSHSDVVPVARSAHVRSYGLFSDLTRAGREQEARAMSFILWASLSFTFCGAFVWHIMTNLYFGPPDNASMSCGEDETKTVRKHWRRRLYEKTKSRMETRAKTERSKRRDAYNSLKRPDPHWWVEERVYEHSRSTRPRP